MSQKPVVINGREYDPHTGVPLMRDHTPHTASSQASPARVHDAGSLHRRTQRSTTLNRRYVTSSIRPTTAVAPAPAPVPVESESVVIPVKHPALQHKIHKFAPLEPVPQAIPVEVEPPTRRVVDIAPVVHPMVQRVQAARSERTPVAQKKTMPKPSDILKAEAIQQALDAAPARSSSSNRQRAPKNARKQRFMPRFLSLASAGTALLLLGGYFTYLNMPNLSVRVAAAQAGIDASYPSYRPSGYSLNGPIAYDNGQVQMKFAANGGPQNFTLTQERSGWDSSAVLDNYVEPKAGDQYVATRDSGLTIYTYGNNAAWVNNGILYTIKGDAPLSTDQISRIATSL